MVAHLLPSLICAAAALLTAAVVPQSKELSKRVEKALKKARRPLTKDLESTRGDALALVCLAAAHDGMGEADEAFKQAIGRLARQKITSTYGLSLRLMVMAKVHKFPRRRELAARDTQSLLKRCAKTGAFGYNDAMSTWDLSNTQYGALGLRAAVFLGQNVRKYVWIALLERVAEAQGYKGGWGYRVTKKGTPANATASMTVAGIAVLEICRHNLGLTGERDASIGRQIREGWRWMAKNRKMIGRSAGPWAFYFHYGLERAAILSQLDKVGGTDWYATGAKMLLKQQNRSGWFEDSSYRRKPGSDPVATAFAVLFLRRTFERLPGPITAAFSYLCHALPAQATVAHVQAAVETDVKRGLRAVPDLLKALRSPIAVRRRACSQALERIAGQNFGYQPESAVELNSAALRRAERWWLKEGRKRLASPKDH